MYSLPPPERSALPKGIVEYPMYRPGSIMNAGLSSAVIWEINAPLWGHIHQYLVFLNIIVINGQNCPSDLVAKTSSLTERFHVILFRCLLVLHRRFHLLAVREG
jgi:hypothetical protein